MKVIGIANNSGYDKRFIVEISELELRNIAGKSYASDIPKIEIGSVVAVSSIFKQLDKLIDEKKNIKQAIKNLKEAIETVENNAQFFKDRNKLIAEQRQAELSPRYRNFRLTY